MHFGTSGENEDQTWVGSLALSLIWNSSALQGAKHADEHSVFKSLSLSGERYRRQMQAFNSKDPTPCT